MVQVAALIPTESFMSGLNLFRGVTIFRAGRGDSMKKLMIALVAVMAVTLVARYSMAEGTQKINGVLIDAKCGKAKNTEEKAPGHPAAYVTKCCGGGSALTLVSGDKTYKLDDASKEKALGYLASGKGEGATRVAVEGTLKDDTLTITSIKKAEKKG